MFSILSHNTNPFPRFAVFWYIFDNGLPDAENRFWLDNIKVDRRLMGFQSSQGLRGHSQGTGHLGAAFLAAGDWFGEGARHPSLGARCQKCTRFRERICVMS